MEFNVKPEVEKNTDEDTLEVFGIVDNGEEIFLDRLDVLSHDGRVYWICQEVFLSEERTEIIDRGDFRVLEKIEIDGEEYLGCVDQDTAREIFESWKESISGDQP